MAVTMKLMALTVTFFGLSSFILGVIAENKKPAAGIPVPGKDGVTCKFPADPTVVLGYLSTVFLIISTVAGYISLFYPYKGKPVPQGALFKSISFTIFFNVALLRVLWNHYVIMCTGRSSEPYRIVGILSVQSDPFRLVDFTPLADSVPPTYSTPPIDSTPLVDSTLPLKSCRLAESIPDSLTLSRSNRKTTHARPEHWCPSWGLGKTFPDAARLRNLELKP
ncbi:hypothetical protein CR513_07156, partial [Mucuna pruriens]